MHFSLGKEKNYQIKGNFFIKLLSVYTCNPELKM